MPVLACSLLRTFPRVLRSHVLSRYLPCMRSCAACFCICSRATCSTYPLAHLALHVLSCCLLCVCSRAGAIAILPFAMLSGEARGLTDSPCPLGETSMFDRGSSKKRAWESGTWAKSSEQIYGTDFFPRRRCVQRVVFTVPRRDTRRTETPSGCATCSEPHWRSSS